MAHPTDLLRLWVFSHGPLTRTWVPYNVFTICINSLSIIYRTTKRRFPILTAGSGALADNVDLPLKPLLGGRYHTRNLNPLGYSCSSVGSLDELVRSVRCTSGRGGLLMTTEKQWRRVKMLGILEVMCYLIASWIISWSLDGRAPGICQERI